ncbi:hypothetical protein GCM10009006_36440 [Haloarcula argentinensis]|uniref:Uncharacterized protein n=1 Tax=Haloarcula argentinensis TaxID=43776 RepID=A0A830FMI5_HALAR|nr:hypothetical protein GCM10009006_36440 [Haloarcula argentinensis]
MYAGQWSDINTSRPVVVKTLAQSPPNRHSRTWFDANTYSWIVPNLNILRVDVQFRVLDPTPDCLLPFLP